MQNIILPLRLLSQSNFISKPLLSSFHSLSTQGVPQLLQRSSPRLFVRLGRSFKRKTDPFIRFTPEDAIPNGNGNYFVPISVLWKAAGFTAVTCSCFYVGATIWQYENVRSVALRRQNRWYNNGYRKAGEWRNDLSGWWNRLPESEKVFLLICTINVLVFIAWRVPALDSVMQRYFLANPSGKSPYLSMFLSTFSHFSIVHLFVNMYVLHSFIHTCVGILGPEQFLAVYLAGGMTASLASHANKIIRRIPGVSLGASGSLMCILGYACTQMPNLQLAIIFLPMVQFSAGQALLAVLAFDSLGVIMNWRFLDHAAHLGGALLGIAWANYGANIWARREIILDKWHSIRKQNGV